MNEQDQQVRQDAVRGKVCRLRQDRAHAKASLTETAQQMEDVGKALRAERSDIAFESLNWINKGTVESLFSDLQKVDAELIVAEREANDLGVVLP